MLGHIFEKREREKNFCFVGCGEDDFLLPAIRCIFDSCNKVRFMLGNRSIENLLLKIPKESRRKGTFDKNNASKSCDFHYAKFMNHKTDKK